MKEGPILALLVAALICFCCGRNAEARPTPDLRERVFRVLQSMPPSVWDADEDPNDREARLDFSAVTIATVSKDDVDAAALLTLWWFESRGALYVYRGCRPEEIPDGAPNCSGGHARSPWQMEESACPEGWELPRGSDEALFEFAQCAQRSWRGALGTCGTIEGAFGLYATGKECKHPQAQARAKGFSLRLQQLRQAP